MLLGFDFLFLETINKKRKLANTNVGKLRSRNYLTCMTYDHKRNYEASVNFNITAILSFVLCQVDWQKFESNQ